jgi:hypothetical protein
MVRMEKIIMKIMKFEKSMVDDEREYILIVENKKKEIYERIFEIGIKGEDVGIRKNGGSV